MKLLDRLVCWYVKRRFLSEIRSGDTFVVCMDRRRYKAAGEGINARREELSWGLPF